MLVVGRRNRRPVPHIRIPQQQGGHPRRRIQHQMGGCFFIFRYVSSSSPVETHHMLTELMCRPFDPPLVPLGGADTVRSSHLTSRVHER